MKMKRIFTPLVALMMLGTASVMITSCSKEDNPSTSEQTVETNYDDLDYLLREIAFFDENYVWDENAIYELPEELDIKVENLEEAVEIFMSWFAPDIDVEALYKVSENFDVPLTDEDGNYQGIVSFRVGSDDDDFLAEVIFDIPGIGARASTRGPLSTYRFRAGDFELGELKIRHVKGLAGILKPDERYMKFVCIKVVEPGKNWFLAITRNKYVPNFDGVVYSDMPDLNRSLEVSKILAEKFEFFQEKFRKAGYGELVRDQLYWIGDSYQENGSTCTVEKMTVD